MLDLGHAHGLLGHVVGERHAHVGGKAPHVIRMQAQAVNQVECLALLGLAPLAGCALAGIGQVTLMQNLLKHEPQVIDLVGGQWLARALHLFVRLQQEIKGVLGPRLVHLLMHINQLAQVVRIAQPVQARQRAVGHPAVVNQCAPVGGQDADGLKRLLAALGVAGNEGQ